MMKTRIRWTTIAVALGSALLVSAPMVASGGEDSRAWNAKAAAAYLDARQEWWMAWPNAARDHDTACVSCHTALPFALSRPILRSALNEATPSPVESKLLDQVV